MMDLGPERSDLLDSVRGRQEGTAVDWAASLLVTLLAIALIEIISRTISVMPAPGPILLLAVVYAAFTGGTLAGMASALLVILYELFFLSNLSGSIADSDRIVRLATLASTAPIMAILVGMLRRNVHRGEISRAILRSEQRYRSLVSASSQVVWSTSADGEIVEHLPTWATFTGQTFEQMKGHGWTDALHPDDRQRTALAWGQAVQNRTPYEIDYRILRADGQWREVHSRGVPIFDPGGSVREWIGTLTDITERRNSERVLIDQTQKLEKINREAEAASRAKDQFLAALSHELRTPLTPVLLTATALENEGLLPEAFRPQIALIRRNVELEARLIDDLLDLTRISRGKLQLHLPRSTRPSLLRPHWKFAPMSCAAKV